jgi:hypothetical protein
MSATRRQRDDDREERLREATGAAEAVNASGRTVRRQLSLVGKLTEGWRRVHTVNHLAQIFRDEGHLG